MRFLGLFWPVWIHLDLNVNDRLLWFLNFNDACLILYDYLKFLTRFRLNIL
jgi:hypothetical protein